jgi:hypothetical protein
MEVSPLCPHFLKTRGIERVLRGSKGLEKTKVRGQVVDKINTTLGSHGGDGGSKPPGTTSNISYLVFLWSGTRWVLFPNCSHFFHPAGTSCWVLFLRRKPYLRFPVIKGHQVDGLQEFLVADPSIPFAHASSPCAVTKDALLNLRVHP